MIESLFAQQKRPNPPGVESLEAAVVLAEGHVAGHWLDAAHEEVHGLAIDVANDVGLVLVLLPLNLERVDQQLDRAALNEHREEDQDQRGREEQPLHLIVLLTLGLGLSALKIYKSILI